MMTRVPPGTRAAAACDRRAEAANSPPPATRQYDYSARTRHDHAPAKPIRSPKSIEQLIKLLDGDPEEIYKAAQDVLGIDVKKPLNRKIVLSRAQCIDLLTAIGRKPTRESAETKARKADPPPLPRADTAKGAAADDGPRAKAADAGGEATDVPAALAGLAFPKLRHRLYIHPEVCDRLSAWPHLHRRLGIMVQHLAANGRSTVVKGCRNDNKGWRRSPLGGNNGMQWYLWWTPAGGGAAARLDAPEDAIVIRDVRHHDDHRTLKPGETGDYLTVGQADEMIDDIAAPPWTDDQKNFIDGREAVRVLLGRPGSGKTTALWRAVEARAGERVLYLTWSPKLAEQARRHLASFAPATTEVVTRDFHTFLGEMSGTDVPARTLAESRALFTDAIRRAGREMGPWSRRPDALHGELRGMYFGQPGGADAEADDGGPIVHIADEEYIRLRDHHAGVGEKSAKALLRIAHALLRDPDKLAAIYPDLAAATTALRRIRGKQLPEGFDRFDRIVVDEVQDLTMLETALVIELAREIGTRRGRRPVMLLAGDPGQTVRPTGFEWSPLITMLKEMLQQPAIVHLDEHLRCPAAIAGIVDRAADWYVQIDKEARPTKQRRQTSAEHVDAQILTVRTDSEREAVQLLSDLHDIEGVAVINPAHEPPAWAPPEHRRRILDPAEAKGLEYQTVCVLDVAKLLVKLKPEDLGYGRSEDLDQAQKRTAIDHLRVSLSRATETLVFLDVSPDGEADAEMEKLVTRSTAIPYTPRDVVEHLRHSETSTEERVLTRIDEARNLIDTSTALACERAGQALHLLGDPDLPNGVPDIDIRTAAAFTMLEAIAVRTVTDPGVNDRETLRPILETAENAITEVVSSRRRRRGAARRGGGAGRRPRGGRDRERRPHGTRGAAVEPRGDAGDEPGHRQPAPDDVREAGPMDARAGLAYRHRAARRGAADRRVREPQRALVPAGAGQARPGAAQPDGEGRRDARARDHDERQQRRQVARADGLRRGRADPRAQPVRASLRHHAEEPRRREPEAGTRDAARRRRSAAAEPRTGQETRGPAPRGRRPARRGHQGVHRRRQAEGRAPHPPQRGAVGAGREARRRRDQGRPPVARGARCLRVDPPRGAEPEAPERRAGAAREAARHHPETAAPQDRRTRRQVAGPARDNGRPRPTRPAAADPLRRSRPITHDTRRAPRRGGRARGHGDPGAPYGA